MDEDNKIVFRAIMEVLGKPKEHVDTTMKSLVNQIKALGDFKVVESFVSETKEQEHLFSSFAELEIEANKMSQLIGFCFDFMPSSIEIISPDELKLTASDMSDLLTDLQAKLHDGDMVTKKLNSVNFFLRKNLNALIKNYVILMLKGGEKDAAYMSKLTGITEKDLVEFLEVLIKEGNIEKTGSGYKLK
ncbi:hypothetical protein KY337_02090 [Candidatus Woesearchaeota archaeon]|nr:hypothetical protein [Candidatus Woesearchaeota archaeon]